MADRAAGGEASGTGGGTGGEATGAGPAPGSGPGPVGPGPAVPGIGTDAGVRGLAALAADPARAAVAVDFDGTLAPIVPDPEDARADPAAVAALGRLGRLVGTVAVVTGRPADAAVAYGGFAGVDGLAGLVVLGHYGAQRWEARTGRTVEAPVPEGVARARGELPGLLADAPDGVHLEDKGRSLAVHTRRAADPDGALERLRVPLAALAERTGLAVEPGRMVVELRPPGVDKGAALTALLAERGAAAVLYAGDDLGDAAAFDAVAADRAAGRRAGLLVYCAADTGEPPLPELTARADAVVPGPAGLARLLDAVADRLTEPGPERR